MQLCGLAVSQDESQDKETARPEDCKTLFIQLGPRILQRYSPVENEMFCH